jgi:hypothetical protein
MFLLSIASIVGITMCCQHNLKVACNYLVTNDLSLKKKFIMLGKKNQTFKQLFDTKTRLFDKNLERERLPTKI